jgi:hypothetical protein
MEKMVSVETIPRMGGDGIKDNGRGSELKYNIFVRTFVNATMYPYPVQKKKGSHEV